MFYYTIQKHLTNIYDLQPLRIVGYVEVFVDEAKTEKLTDIPFGELGINLTFNDVPHSTIEEFNTTFEDIVMTQVNEIPTQDKLNEIKMAYDLGLI